VCTVIGLVLLIVPGVYVFIRLHVCAQSVVAEKLGPVNAIRRSHQLVEGNGWRALVYFDLRARFEGAPEPRVQHPAFEPIAQPERP
jgi:hypothetical protein